jgi:NAD(P)H dehydrogenase (quinone)
MKQMKKILVTGASGDIGRKTLKHLLEKKPANQLVGLVRDFEKAKDLADLGIELRKGDYMEPDSLKKAFRDVEKLMLVSTHAFTERKTAHANAVDAAVESGVQHVVFMPISRKKNSNFTMKEITEEDIFTKQKLEDSGLDYTFAEHPPFLDVLGFYIGTKAHETGIRVPPGTGKFAAATRDDLAAAHAAILTGKGHENKTYTLTGDPAVSFSDIAKILSKIHGKEVPYIEISDKEYIDLVKSNGVPDFVAEFVLKWVQGMSAGEWQDQTNHLEKLIGHKPKTAAEYFHDEFIRAQAQPAN